mmetsp:Transcript_66674/g.143837  ORF Transcript_66674/g.143837 Transcript_66674/m.143837 type:complete len:91 (+) Transcript_66674:1327-1599(+)
MYEVDVKALLKSLMKHETQLPMIRHGVPCIVADNVQFIERIELDKANSTKQEDAFGIQQVELFKPFTKLFTNITAWKLNFLLNYSAKFSE